ncbi:MAG: DNA mismatch repair endonuclease MutL [Oscillospiraceae bacterium]|nr:DNA mismatch repair endonuclease MutL [Oscillospiraceae bacterium]
MGIINILDKHTADLIAAGEVVERPASALKELCENAIDAGATDITVEIKNGGSVFMRVTDNGCGIAKDDVKKAFMPHATSKLHTGDDLAAIATLGFRGEALASIAAVAKVQMLTKHSSEQDGTSYVIEGGTELKFEAAGCPNGTTIIVRDLFYNIPARMKFLKKDVTESNAAANVIDKIALSHPGVKITFIRDSKITLKTTGDGKLLSAIYAVFGKEFAAGMLPVKYELNGVTAEGYVTKPENARANRNMQNFFVNGRYVKSRTAGAAIDEASKGTVMVQKFSACVINITVDWAQVDVNVHPAKIEVRFINERPIFDCVYHGVKSAFFGDNQRKQINFNHGTTPFEPIKKANPFEVVKNSFYSATPPAKSGNAVGENANAFTDTKPVQNNTIFAAGSLFQNEPIIKSNPVVRDYQPAENAQPTADITPNVPANVTKTDKIDIEPEITDSQTEGAEQPPVFVPQSLPQPAVFIGEAFGTYIIAQQGDELLMIDKHAAHERIIYEQLKAQSTTLASQYLLTPLSINLSKQEYDAAIDNCDVFEKSGFEIEDFGSGTILVRSAPAMLEKEDITQAVEEICGKLLQNKGQPTAEKIEWIFHNVACRAAIKAGNKSTQPELLEILRQVTENNDIKHCPHGRPVCTVLKKSQIEKTFGRV